MYQPGFIFVQANIKSASLRAVVRRADRTIEDLGVIASCENVVILNAVITTNLGRTYDQQGLMILMEVPN